MRFSSPRKSENVIHNLRLRTSLDISSTKRATCDPSGAFKHSYTSPRDAAQSFRLMKRCSPLNRMDSITESMSQPIERFTLQTNSLSPRVHGYRNSLSRLRSESTRLNSSQLGISYD